MREGADIGGFILVAFVHDKNCLELPVCTIVDGVFLLFIIVQQNNQFMA